MDTVVLYASAVEDIVDSIPASPVIASQRGYSNLFIKISIGNLLSLNGSEPCRFVNCHVVCTLPRKVKSVNNATDSYTLSYTEKSYWTSGQKINKICVLHNIRA